MKNLFLLIILATLIFSCEKEDQFMIDSSNHSEFRYKPDYVKACHFDRQTQSWVIMDLQKSEIEIHKQHGDVFDMDNDGFFEKENFCQIPIDCNDSNNLVHSCAFCGYTDNMVLDKHAIYFDTDLKVSGNAPQLRAFETWISSNYKCGGYQYIYVFALFDKRGFYAGSEVYIEVKQIREKMILSYDDAVMCREMIQNIAKNLGLKNQAWESEGRIQLPHHIQ
jgi:hypothetical protein